MEHVTLELSFRESILDYIMEQCYQQGILPEQYLSNLVGRDKEKQNEEESERP